MAAPSSGATRVRVNTRGSRALDSHGARQQPNLGAYLLDGSTQKFTLSFEPIVKCRGLRLATRCKAEYDFLVWNGNGFFAANH